MAYSDTYIANHQDKLLRLGDVWAAKQVGLGSRNQEVVRVASRRWEELVSKGYRVVNPAHRHHRNTVLGISKVLSMTMPGYALAHEAVKNPVEGLTYTTWGAVVLMKERAKEYGEPGMVAVIPESTANMAWEKAQMAETKMARVQAGVPRMALEVFGVVDRPRVYGYAPEKWVDEFSAKVGEKQERDQHERVAASEKEAVKAWGRFVDEYNRIGRKYMEKLEAVVVRYETAARTAIEDLRAGYGVTQPVKQEVQHTGGAVLSKIGAAGTTAGSKLMGLAKAVEAFVDAVTATPELTPLEPGWEKWVDRPETGMRKRKGRR